MKRLIPRSTMVKYCSITLFCELTSLVISFSMTMSSHTLQENADIFNSKTTFMTRKIGRFIPSRTHLGHPGSQSSSKELFVTNPTGTGRKEMFYITTHSTHYIYGYMASDIWLRTILIVRKETCCRHIGYSFRLTARVLLYAPSHR